MKISSASRLFSQRNSDLRGTPCLQDATLAFGRMRVVAMAVTTCNPPISVVDDEFSSLIAANLATAINSFLFGFAVSDYVA